MIRTLLGACALAALLAAGPAAQAHVPYLLPNVFDATGRDHITVQGAFTETPFSPEVVMKAADYHAVGPDGARMALPPTYLTDLAVVELATKTPGTWRISTGQRTGRVAKAALVKGDWVFLEPDKPAPDGATAVDMISLTKAETYVSRGAPNAAALAPTGQGLEFQALTHPSSILAGQDARFVLLFDGQPLAGQTITVTRGDAAYADGAKPFEVVSDAAGAFVLKVAQPGVYLAMTRHRLAPTAAAPVGRSFTYALTFEAVR